MDDIAAIVSIIVIFPSIIAYAVVSVKKAKYRAMESGGSDGLRASELQRLIREAVEEAVEPLHDRLDALDAADRRPEAARLDPAVLADALEDPEDRDEPAAVRRRTRS